METISVLVNNRNYMSFEVIVKRSNHTLRHGLVLFLFVDPANVTKSTELLQ